MLVVFANVLVCFFSSAVTFIRVAGPVCSFAYIHSRVVQSTRLHGAVSNVVAQIAGHGTQRCDKEAEPLASNGARRCEKKTEPVAGYGAQGCDKKAEPLAGDAAQHCDCKAEPLAGEATPYFDEEAGVVHWR